jgi:hypothetical protein
MPTSPNSSTARRDNLEIDEWARTCGRDVSPGEINMRRDLKKARRKRAKNRRDYAGLLLKFSKSAAACAAKGKSTTKPKPS